MMAARSISSRMTSSVATSPSYAAGLNRSQGSLSSLSSPRAAYSFSSGYNNLYQGYSFSSYIASSSSGYSTISSTTPVVLRRKTSQLSRQEYKTRSKSVDASLYVSEQCGDSSVHGQPHERCESRAASVLPDLELPGDDDLERVRTKPVRNRQSHGVSQYDLERAATWAMIGSNKSITNDSKSEQEAIPVQMKNETSEIDYKKLWEESQAENTRLRLEINTVRFDLEVAKRQLTKIKEEKLCQMERIIVVEKIAKIEDELKESPRLKSENKKLISENKALSRVVSKLSLQ